MRNQSSYKIGTSSLWFRFLLAFKKIFRFNFDLIFLFVNINKRVLQTNAVFEITNEKLVTFGIGSFDARNVLYNKINEYGNHVTRKPDI